MINNSQWTAFGAQCDDRVSALLANSATSFLETRQAEQVTPEEMATLLFSAGFGGAEVDEEADFIVPEMIEPLS